MQRTLYKVFFTILFAYCVIRQFAFSQNCFGAIPFCILGAMRFWKVQKISIFPTFSKMAKKYVLFGVLQGDLCKKRPRWTCVQQGRFFNLACPYLDKRRCPLTKNQPCELIISFHYNYVKRFEVLSLLPNRNLQNTMKR